MKRLVIFSFLMIFSIVSVTYSQTSTTPEQPSAPQEKQAQKTEAPELPDYTKDPYTLFTEDPLIPNGTCDQCSPLLHKDWGKVLSKIYRDNKSISRDTLNWIMVFFNKDATIRYAEWVEWTLKGAPAGKYRETFRGYLYKDGKFVFEKEESKDIDY